MFQHACRMIRSTIRPIIRIVRFHSGEVKWEPGAGMFVNEDGWFLTATHIIEDLHNLQQVTQSNQPKKTLRETDITHYAYAIGTVSGAGRKYKAKIERALDVGVLKVEGIVPPADYRFPEFHAQEVEQGELLCRAGFPLLKDEYSPTWSAEKGFRFNLGSLLPSPMFVTDSVMFINEALVSRFRPVHYENGKRVGRLIQTSSPGLIGQSGGPLVDDNGLIRGIQVSTRPYPLGFEAEATHQQLHVGQAVASGTIMEYLDWKGIKYRKF